MPAVLPDNVNKALKSKVLEAKHRSHICRAVVRKCIEERKDSNRHLKKAASKIIKKYSPMKRKMDPDAVRIFKSNQCCEY